MIGHYTIRAATDWLRTTRGPFIVRVRGFTNHLRPSCVAAGLSWFTLHADQMRDRKSAHAHLQQVFSLPAYYGHNWDALDDCLSDEWVLADAGSVVWLDCPERIHPALLHPFFQVFSDAAKQWNQERSFNKTSQIRPFHLLLHTSACTGVLAQYPLINIHRR